MTDISEAEDEGGAPAASPRPSKPDARRRSEATRTDLRACLGQEILVLVRDPGQLAAIPMKAPGGSTWHCTLVGHDDEGLWVEPLAWVHEARAGRIPSVWHVLIPWSNVSGVVVDSNRSRASTLGQRRATPPPPVQRPVKKTEHARIAARRTLPRRK